MEVLMSVTRPALRRPFAAACWRMRAAPHSVIAYEND
jgi:hypothetical protein